MSDVNWINSATGLEIAIIGIAGRFPGAPHIDQFWQNLKNGVETIYFFSQQELDAASVDPEVSQAPNYVNVKGGGLEDKECFDANFFQYTPNEAKKMDPQVRIFHQCSWAALENAGYVPAYYSGLIGLYAGATANFYWEALTFLSGKINNIEGFSVKMLNDKDFLTSQVSYNLDLKGPSITIQSACSTSLVAIHLACQGLLSGDCDMALAGGVSIPVSNSAGYLYREGMIVSRDGHCRAFDAKGTGTVFGEGVGVVILKTLEDAVAAGDYIYAVIKSSAVNNDGRYKVGYAALSIQGQVKVIRSALRVARAAPESISYIEAHGTATSIGDPIEIEALKQAFDSRNKRFCALGSVKTNIGHLGSAAGVAGFIKTVLALKHKLIPPSLHFESPNPKLDILDSPFYINRELKKWENGKFPLRAGVSSFGIGGTNAHLVLEEWPSNNSASNMTRSEEQKASPLLEDKGRGEVFSTEKLREYQLILLSAKTGIALDKMTENLVNYLKNNRHCPANPDNRKTPNSYFANVAYTLQVGREMFHYKRKVVCTNINEAIELLSNTGSRKVNTHFSKQKEPTVVFIFPGLGAQYPGMGLELYKTEPVFREETDRCFNLLQHLVDYDIKEILYPDLYPAISPPPALGDSLPIGECSAPAGALHSGIDQIDIAQMAVFIFEYALAKLLIKWGVTPDAMMGYSFGEYTAACISGVMSLEDTLSLLAARGRLIGQVPEGAMLSVPLPLDQVRPLLVEYEELDVAIDNGPSCIVAGTKFAVAVFAKQMKKQKFICKSLNFSHAIHSKMMQPILIQFEEKAAGIRVNEPQIPYISNVTGTWLNTDDILDPCYWARHLRETVRFADGIKELLEKEHVIFIEVGPGRDLSELLTPYINGRSSQKVINLVRPESKKVSDIYYLLNKMGQLWLYGKRIHWQAFHGENNRKRIPLPSYPFEKVPYPIENNLLQAATKWLSENSTDEKTGDFEHCFYMPTWKRSPILYLEQNYRPGKAQWLVFMDKNQNGLGLLFTQRLKALNHPVISVMMGNHFRKQDSSQYIIDPTQDKDFQRLFNQVAEICKPLNHTLNIIHFWSVGPASGEKQILGMNEFEKAQALGFYSLLKIVRAIVANGKQGVECEYRFGVVTNNMQDVTGAETLDPQKATMTGLLKVISQEYPHIRCQSVDILLPKPGSWQEAQLVTQLMEEFTHWYCDTDVAYRNTFRWQLSFESLQLKETHSASGVLKEKGVYLVTGGLGTIGLTLAEHLAKELKARLILTGRSSFPFRQQWQHWLNSHKKEDNISVKIRKLMELESHGAQVLTLSADAANQQEMERVIRRAELKWGTIDGLIHAAGITWDHSFKVISKLDREQCLHHFQPKVHGLMILDKLFRDKPLDFCCVISCISSFLGGLGFAAEAAANSFMDAYVRQVNRIKPIPWTCLNWDDMEKEMKVMAFQRILSQPHLKQVVVSKGGQLEKRIQRWVKREGVRHEQEQTKTPSTLTPPRPPLDNPYVAPRNPREQAICCIWLRLFGFERIGVQDDFLELGGDSLKAFTVLNVIHKELKVEVPLTQFFKQPTIEKLAQYIHKVENIALNSTFTPFQPVEEKEYHLLSSAQKRMYLMQQLNLESTAYNTTLVNIVESPIDKVKLENSFKKLINRHESLRTSIFMLEGLPVQKIHKEVVFELEFYYDFFSQQAITGSTSAAGRQMDRVEKIVIEFVKPFDLGKVPFLRVGLIRIEEDKHILAIDVHHVVVDGISLQIFYHQLTSLYSGQQLPPLKLQYKDYAQWQNQQRMKKTAAFKKQEQFWLKNFKDSIPVLNLPTDYLRPNIKNFKGNTVVFDLPKQEVMALKKLILEEDVTLFILLLSLFNVLLAKICGQEDIIIGTPIAGRRHVDLYTIIGMFINTLALRNYPKGAKSFGQFLKEVKQCALVAFENQDFQFEDLVESLDLAMDISRNPLFDVMLILQNIETKELDRKGLQSKSYPYRTEISRFDLTLTVTEREDKISMSLSFSTALFKHHTINRYINYLKRIISEVIENLDKKISEIEIISLQEKSQILNDFNNTFLDQPPITFIHDQFLHQVEQTSDHTALIGQIPNQEGTGHSLLSVHLSYKELNDKSLQLAQVLKAKGVQPDTIVGIMVERSLLMMIGILGILKAGGAYLPIDPDYPQERVSYILSDSATDILLKDNDLTPKAFCPEGDFSQPHLPPVSATSLAYVIYTSGSTGKPKGVLIENRSLVNFIKGITGIIDFKGSDNILSLTTISFDIFGLETILPLAKGSKVVIGDREEQINVEAAAKALLKEKITILQLTPSRLFTMLQNEESSQALKSLTCLLVGGETFPGHLLEETTKIVTGNIYNLYGPTETTIWSTVKHLTAGKSLNIGKPIANTKIFILSQWATLQPTGVVGEICIGGGGLARGYLNNIELTIKKFILNPYEKGESLYCTGDLARWLPDGNIDFLGRLDHQVKIRGFRIEPAEIETQLLRFVDIKEAVVIARGDESRGIKTGVDIFKYLCAYVVSDKKLPISELREHLAKRLPEYMIPSFFIPIDSIPLTPNGKLDKKALESQGTPLYTEVGYIAPQTELESTIANIWQEVLGVDKVGIDDNFFNIGGNSVKVIQLNRKLKDELQVDIPVVLMYRYLTIRSFVGYLNNQTLDEGIPAGEMDESITLMEETNRMLMAVNGEMEGEND
jgi:amino acid adenylation domain-containing protein